MVEEQVQIIRKEKANSYEFGKVGDRFKLYFETAEDLKAQIDVLEKLGLYENLNKKQEEK